MHVLGLLLLTIGKILRLLINLYIFVLGASALVSWLNPDPHNPIVRLLYQLTYPVLIRIRRLMPRALYSLPIDASPIIALLILVVIDTLLVGLLFDFAANFLSK